MPLLFEQQIHFCGLQDTCFIFELRIKSKHRVNGVSHLNDLLETPKQVYWQIVKTDEMPHQCLHCLF